MISVTLNTGSGLGKGIVCWILFELGICMTALTNLLRKVNHVFLLTLEPVNRVFFLGKVSMTYSTIKIFMNRVLELRERDFYI
jgi:hypothetical protein